MGKQPPLPGSRAKDVMCKRWDTPTEFLEHIEHDLDVIRFIRPRTYFVGTVPNFPYVSHVRHFQDCDEVTSPDYSPTREIDQRRPFWRLDDPQHTRISGSSSS